MTIELITPKKLYSVEEFFLLPEDDNRYELVEGELVKMSGPNYLHGKITIRLINSIGEYLKRNPIGEILTNMCFVLSSQNAPIPDVAFVQTERLKGIDPHKGFPGAPDLAIEVISPSDTLERVYNKTEMYRKFGVKLIWSVYILDKFVLIHRPNNIKPTFVGLDDELNGENVLPGFNLPINELFN